MIVSQEEFDTAVDAIDVVHMDPEQAMRIVAARFPQMTGAEFGELMGRYLARLDARLTSLDEQMDAAKAVVDALDGEPETASVQEALRRRAAAGDPAAQALVEQFESVSVRLRGALFDAAVAVHPDWHEVGPGRFQHRPPRDTPKVDPLDAPEKLIDWFIDTYPAEASAIAERINGAKTPEVAAVTETPMPSDPPRVEAALIAGFLASRHYRCMPALLVVEEIEREDADERDRRLKPLDSATMLDLKRAVAVQDLLLERQRASLEQEMAHRGPGRASGGQALARRSRHRLGLGPGLRPAAPPRVGAAPERPSSAPASYRHRGPCR